MQAGATAVVPETLEPSLQLASAVLSQLNMPQDEVAHAIQAFRRNHISELQVGAQNTKHKTEFCFCSQKRASFAADGSLALLMQCASLC